MASSTVQLQVNCIAASPSLDSINLFNNHCLNLLNSETILYLFSKLPSETILYLFSKLPSVEEIYGDSLSSLSLASLHSGGISLFSLSTWQVEVMSGSTGSSCAPQYTRIRSMRSLSMWPRSIMAAYSRRSEYFS